MLTIKLPTAGGEAAIMPSSTKILVPQEVPASTPPKRKLETTVSTDNATGGVKKKEKPVEPPRDTKPIEEVMEVDVEPSPPAEVASSPQKNEVKAESLNVNESLKKIGELCDELMEKTDEKKVEKVSEKPKAPVVKPETPKKTPVKRETVKNKTSDLAGVINSIAADTPAPVNSTPALSNFTAVNSTPVVERQNSSNEESGVVKAPEKRKSRILETAEKFQNMNNQNNEKYKKFSIPGVSVGNFKKEFERKASLTSSEPRKLSEKLAEPRDELPQKTPSNSVPQSNSSLSKASSNLSHTTDEEIKESDSRNSVPSFSLEEARRSMDNSIALLNKAKSESQSREMDQLCLKTESVELATDESDRERKLREAREIIGNHFNAIPPSRLFGVRKPPMAYGLHGRSVSGSVVQTPVTRKATPAKSSSMEQQQQPAARRFTPSRVVPEQGISLFV